MKNSTRCSFGLAAFGALALVLSTFRSGSSAADEPTAAARQTPAADRSGWKLVWSDEFDKPEIDRTKWDFDRGNGFQNKDSNTWIGGWGNNELEFYTDRPDNVFIRDGLLHIVAIKEKYKGFQYTSARMNTRKKDGSALFAKRYGRFEFRAKLPLGQGVWPAIWMRSQDDKYGAWAASGEIDILEAKGQHPSTVQGTIHFGSGWPHNTYLMKETTLPNRGTIADFHVYAVEWEPGEIRWYVDDQLYSTQNFWWSCSDRQGGQGLPPENLSELNPWPAPFDQPFFITINLAIGGNFLGNPDASTPFPAEMLLDYVRVYDKVGGYGEPKPRRAGKFPFEKK